jgi:hypothetical protein
MAAPAPIIHSGQILGTYFPLMLSALTAYKAVMKKYEIAFWLKKGNSGQQKTTVQASDSFTARRIFTQQNPGCRIISVPIEVREDGKCR